MLPVRFSKRVVDSFLVAGYLWRISSDLNKWNNFRLSAPSLDCETTIRFSNQGPNKIAIKVMKVYFPISIILWFNALLFCKSKKRLLLPSGSVRLSSFTWPSDDLMVSVFSESISFNMKPPIDEHEQWIIWAKSPLAFTCNSWVFHLSNASLFSFSWIYSHFPSSSHSFSHQFHPNNPSIFLPLNF